MPAPPLKSRRQPDPSPANYPKPTRDDQTSQRWTTTPLRWLQTKNVSVSRNLPDGYQRHRKEHGSPPADHAHHSVRASERPADLGMIPGGRCRGGNLCGSAHLGTRRCGGVQPQSHRSGPRDGSFAEENCAALRLFKPMRHDGPSVDH